MKVEVRSQDGINCKLVCCVIVCVCVCVCVSTESNENQDAE